MKKLLLIAALFTSFANADDYVNGYVRKDGTYVEPHFRSESNSYRYDNYSSQGNLNPYTGARGYEHNEYSTPPAYNQGYGNPYSQFGRSYQNPR
jgi:hypothetical protein